LPTVAQKEEAPSDLKGEQKMDIGSCSIGDVTTKVAATMEESLQAFAIRAACFVGELDVPFSEEFDGRDFDATHVLAYVGNEPAGALRLRWFQSFAMPERLAVVQRLRGHDLGRQLLEHSYRLAESRGCNLLYSRVARTYVKYLEKQDWRRLEPEGQSIADRRTVALIRSVDLAKPLPGLDAVDALRLERAFHPENRAVSTAKAGTVESVRVPSAAQSEMRVVRQAW
jgi:GNAT superfamily N-acetyltransferase